MAEYEVKPNTGSLFRNEKPNGDTDRHYQGNCKIECPHCKKESEHWMSAWINEARTGKKYMKLAFNPKDEPQRSIDDFDDQDVPF